jgi:hypothetical protein
MRSALSWFAVFALAVNCGNAGSPVQLTSTSAPPAATYLGFDRNEYPGDSKLAALHRTFSYTSYWLNSPPGAASNTWVGRRQAVEAAGFGFLILFNGRLDAELKKAPDASALGKSDAGDAVAAARHEGFPARATIFLDQEEGGRMLPEQRAYIHAWVDVVNGSGFRAGVYCSGIAAPEGKGVAVVTAEDIQQNAGGRKIVFWVVNDACPPSPGCMFPKRAPPPSRSGVAFADVWQFAQSPKRRDVAAACPSNYDPDGSCYPPGVTRDTHLFVDLNTANSDDPSGGKSRAR